MADVIGRSRGIRRCVAQSTYVLVVYHRYEKASAGKPVHSVFVVGGRMLPISTCSADALSVWLSLATLPPWGGDTIQNPWGNLGAGFPRH